MVFNFFCDITHALYRSHFFYPEKRFACISFISAKQNKRTVTLLFWTFFKQTVCQIE